MRDYDFSKKLDNVLDIEIFNLISEIKEYKGKQLLYIDQKPEELKSLLDIAKVQSVEMSNKIEGIYTSNKRIEEIVNDKTTPKNRDEEEITGYRDVLGTIHENFDHIGISSNVLLQLHRDLYAYSVGSGGKFKNSNNIIEETLLDGSKRVRFEPVDSFMTPDSIENLCDEYKSIISKREIDPLIIINIFILDFLCIHPFSDGNGRMSRLLTLLLMYQEDYSVGKYISIEKIIEETKEKYYGVLEKSSINWHENTNDYKPFVKYMLEVVLKAYREFEERIDLIISKERTKPEQIEYILKNSLKSLSKEDISKKCPHISPSTLNKTITLLVQDKKILKLGNARSTSYIWNNK